MPIDTVPISDWKLAVEIADRLDIGDEINSTYLFRGQEDENWRLTPSLTRAATNDGTTGVPDVAELLRVEKHLLSQFRKVAANHLPPATLNTTAADYDWWTVMRHYGVPTRLLDWTRSF